MSQGFIYPRASRLPSSDIAFIASGFGLLTGSGTILAGFAAFSANVMLPLVVALMVIGGAILGCSYAAMHGSRAGWSFATVLHGCGAVALLFGAPQIRDAVGATTFVGLMPFFFFAAATVLFANAGGTYFSITMLTRPGLRESPLPGSEQSREAPGATAAFVCGLLSIFILPPVLGTVAMIQATGARKAVREDPTYTEGSLATAGAILGAVGIALWTVIILLALYTDWL